MHDRIINLTAGVHYYIMCDLNKPRELPPRPPLPFSLLNVRFFPLYLYAQTPHQKKNI